MRSGSIEWRGASRLPPMGQGVAVVVVLALVAALTLLGVGGYLVSLRIAAARAEVARLDRVKAAQQADVRTLQQDYEIRSRLPELDRWGQRLDLSAPAAGQFVARSGAITATAQARQHALEEEAVRRVVPDPRPGYPVAARTDLDKLIDTVGG